MSFVLIYKASQVVNFAQGEFLLVGAWVCWWMLTEWQLPFWAGFLFTLAFMTLFGIILQVVVLRPLIGEPVISVIMATIGLGIFFQALMKWIFGVFAKPFPPIFTTERVNLLGLEVQTVYLLSLGISVLIMAGFAWFFTPASMAWRCGRRPSTSRWRNRSASPSPRSSPCPGRSRRSSRRSPASSSAW